MGATCEHEKFKPWVMSRSPLWVRRKSRDIKKKLFQTCLSEAKPFHCHLSALETWFPIFNLRWLVRKVQCDHMQSRSVWAEVSSPYVLWRCSWKPWVNNHPLHAPPPRSGGHLLSVSASGFDGSIDWPPGRNSAMILFCFWLGTARPCQILSSPPPRNWRSSGRMRSIRPGTRITRSSRRLCRGWPFRPCWLYQNSFPFSSI